MRDDVCEFLIVDDKKVRRIQQSLDSDATQMKISEIFKILSDPTRLKIIQALQSDDLCVCDIAALIGLPQPSVSHHLRALRQLGIAKYVKNGKMAIYSIADSRISALTSVARDFIRRNNG